MISPPAQQTQPHSGSTPPREQWIDSQVRLVDAASLCAQLLTLPGLEIARELGRGGMGLVYLARQTALNRWVAVKMLRSALWATPKDKARFQREAEALAQLHHPHIVKLFALDTVRMSLEGDQPYMVLEYVPGLSLDQVLGGWSLPPQVAARLVLHLADAVQAAHAKGILHRDLKPSNVLVAFAATETTPAPTVPEEQPLATRLRQALQEGTPDVLVKLTDFGLARFGPGDLTTVGVALGTPAYMAPEQALAEADPTAAVDVYGLGVILYETLTAHPPYFGASAVEIFQQVQHWEPVRPRQLRPFLPRDLETICLKCLQKNPAQRYSSAAALAEDLRRFLEGQPIQARPVGRLERVWSWCRRQPLVASLTGGLLLLLLLSSIVAWWLAAWALGEKVRADGQAQQAEENLAEARRAVDECFRLAEKDPLFLAEAVNEQRRRLLQAALPFYRRFREQARQDQLLTAEQADLCGKLAVIAEAMGDTRAALEWSLEARDLWERLGTQAPQDADLTVRLARVQTYLVTLQGDRGDMAAAAAAFHKADDMFARLVQANPKNSDAAFYQAKNWSSLGYQYLKQDRAAAAQALLAKALAELRRLAAAAPRDGYLQRETISVGISLAYAHLQTGRLEEAAALLTEIQGKVERGGATQPEYLDHQQNLVQVWNGLSLVATARSQHAAALDHLERARQLSDQQLALFPRNGKLLHRHAELLLGLSNAHMRLQKVVPALNLLAEAKALHQRLQHVQPEGADQVIVYAGICCNRGQLLCKLRRSREALAEFTEAEKVLQPLVRRHPENQRAVTFLFNTCAGLAELHTQQQDFMEAAQAWQRAIPFAPTANRLAIRSRYVISLSSAHEHDQAVTEAQRLAQEPDLSANTLANLARVFVRSTGEIPVSDPRHEERCRAALELLRRAKAKGYRNWAGLRIDPDMAPLRNRPEWRDIVPAK